MKVRAIILDTVRELLYRKTLLFYFGLVTLTHIILILALQTDVANGAITSMRVFGLEGRTTGHGFALGNEAGGAPEGLTAATLTRGIQGTVTFILYPIGIMLSVFAAASLIPRMLERGVIDLLLSKPVSRTVLFLSRYLGALLVAGVNLVYLVGGVGVILGFKTGYWNWGFMLSGLMMTVYFGALLGYLVLIGAQLRSATLGIMLTAVLYVLSLIVYLPHVGKDWPMLLTNPIARFAAQGVVETIYYALPRTIEFSGIVADLIMQREVATWMPVLGTIGSGAGALALALWLFNRTDF